MRSRTQAGESPSCMLIFGLLPPSLARKKRGTFSDRWRCRSAGMNKPDTHDSPSAAWARIAGGAHLQSLHDRLPDPLHCTLCGHGQPCGCAVSLVLLIQYLVAVNILSFVSFNVVLNRRWMKEAIHFLRIAICIFLMPQEHVVYIWMRNRYAIY